MSQTRSYEGVSRSSDEDIQRRVENFRAGGMITLLVVGGLVALLDGSSPSKKELKTWTAKADQIDTKYTQAIAEKSPYFKQKIVNEAAEMERSILDEMSRYTVIDNRVQTNEITDPKMAAIANRLASNWVSYNPTTERGTVIEKVYSTVYSNQSK